MGAVMLEGAPNFRDVGGRVTTDHGRVRRGMVFRSDSLHRLTAGDLATLEQVGLRVVYELRGDEECERAPSVLPEGVRCERLPVGGTAARTQELTDLVVAGRLADVPSDFLDRIYEAGIDDDHYRAVFGAPRRAMAVLLETLRARHGSVAGYLRDEAGVGADVVDALRAQLLEMSEPCSSDQE